MENEYIEDEYLEISVYKFNSNYTLFLRIINQGIDSRLESFTKLIFNYNADENRLYLNFHYDEIQILIRRLIELQNKYENDNDNVFYRHIEFWINGIIEIVYGYEMI